MKKINKISKKELTAELHNLGIKTYRKKSTGEIFVKEKDIKTALATNYTIKDTKAASDCIDYVLEHEAEDYYEQSRGHGITKTNWEHKWDEVEHVYVSALKAIGKNPDVNDFEP